MGLHLVQEMRCLNNGITDSVFVRTEHFLYSSSKHQEGLSSLWDNDRYESLMDFFFCIVFPEYRGKCFQFYLDRRFPLNKLLPKGALRKYDELLLLNLKSMRSTEDWEILSDIAI